MQMVTNRVTSTFKNVLLVYDIRELLGNPVYDCYINSGRGSVTGDISGGLTGT